jgi:hypothetical protein
MQLHMNVTEHVKINEMLSQLHTTHSVVQNAWACPPTPSIGIVRHHYRLQ